MTYIVEYILAKNDKGTPYHWVQAFDADRSPGVFVLRAWGKKPGQVKSMAFKSHSQCAAYYNKWVEDKKIDKHVEIGKFDTIEALIQNLELQFSWLDMREHTDMLSEATGVQHIPTPKSVILKSQVPVQQLPETYGWW